MRQVPPVAFIESALETFGQGEEGRTAAVKELRGLGTARRNKYRDLDPTLTNFERGYLLGLKVAQLLDEAMPKLPGDQS